MKATRKQIKEAIRIAECKMNSELFQDIVDNKGLMASQLTPVTMIIIATKAKGMSQKDLIGVLGDKANVSRILNRKRKLTVDMIRKLHEKLEIPLEFLVQDYEIIN